MLRPAVLYDGSCGMCTGWAEWLRTRDAQGRLEFIPAQDTRAESISGKSVTELMSAMHWVGPDGTIVAGAAAVCDAIAYVNGVRWPSRLVRLPVVRTIAEMMYRVIARYRYRISGSNNACEIPRRK